ncbi:Hypothetical protein LUCI_1985 [Lucifera butyrica]|uniref:Phosphoglycolate phosphatase n=1 Tax=Lucifera butyrica TaxID=1351585 RepID=A0A498R6E1_9FIRM|nr:HAD family hydrolase [Lucifera butyrica]VBB06749.1 Hypothetical protein LUCI_1985 [Lucifera butyrica]
MKNYEVILFDLDGTLIDPKEGITKSVHYALEKFGIAVHDLDELTPFIGPPLTDSFEEYYGFSPEQARQAVLYYREYFSVKGVYENKVYPGMDGLLDQLRDAEKKLIVATSKPSEFAEIIIRHWGLDPYFALVAGSNLNGTRIKKAEVIEYILEQLAGVEKSKVVMVGDRKHDIIGADEAGIDSIAVAYGYGSLAELTAAHPTHLVQSIAELRNLLLTKLPEK